MTFTATSGTTTHGAQEIDLQSLSLGANSVTITHPGIIAALGSGNTISHSLKLEYSGLSVVETAGAVYVPPPDYSVKDLQTIGGFSQLQSGKYMFVVRFKHSSVGGIYGHKLSFYPTSNPANETVMFTYTADGITDNHALIPLEAGTNYTAAVKLVNKHTGEELTNLQSVQTVTFTTPTPPPPPPLLLPVPNFF
jgi:hypothetical protein